MFELLLTVVISEKSCFEQKNAWSRFCLNKFYCLNCTRYINMTTASYWSHANAGPRSLHVTHQYTIDIMQINLNAKKHNSQYKVNANSIQRKINGGGDSCMRHSLDLQPHGVSQRRPLHHVHVQFSSITWEFIRRSHTTTPSFTQRLFHADFQQHTYQHKTPIHSTSHSLYVSLRSTKNIWHWPL